MADFSASSLLVPFGRTATGEIVTPAQVPRGLACNCTCAGCGAALVANQGERKVWHFSHQANSDCKSGYESAIHAAMKQLLMSEKRIMLPSLAVWAYPPDMRKANVPHPRDFGDLELASGKHEFQHYMEDLIGRGTSKAKLIEFDEVIEESREGNIQPDIIGVVGDRRLYIEVAATHLVDQEKERKTRERGVAMIEIRLPYEKGIAPDFDMLRRLLLAEVTPAEKYWISNPVVEHQAVVDLEKRSVAHKAKRARDERARAAKKERYETLYKPTHRLQMHDPHIFPRVTAELDLCPSFISLRAFGDNNKTAFEAINEVSRAYRGTFDKTGERRFWKWKIQPASVDLFVAVALSLKERGLYIARGARNGCFMPEHDIDWIMLKLF